MTELFVDPLVGYGFVRTGLAAALIVGVVSAVLSCLLVVRHQALMGDAISHAVLLGVVLGYLVMGRPGILPGALVVALLSGAAMTYLERHTSIKLDAVMGIVFTFAFALGLAIMSAVEPRGIDLFHVLFGNLLGVSSVDLVVTAVSGALVLAVIAVGFRAFELWSFDPQMARAVGMRVTGFEYLFTGLLSATIVASLQAVGIVLVIAMLITPGAAALLLTSRLRSMMLLAVAIGLAASLSGFYASFHLDVASGPAIVIAVSLLFALALAVAPLRRRRLARRAAEPVAAANEVDAPAR